MTYLEKDYTGLPSELAEELSHALTQEEVDAVYGKALRLQQAQKLIDEARGQTAVLSFHDFRLRRASSAPR